MKTTTVTGSRFFLLTLVIGSAAITPTLFGGNGSPNVPPSAVVLGLKASPPKLVISDPTKGLPPYVPPAPPAPLSTITLTFSDFTPYVSPGTTQGWQQGSTPETIMIPPQPDSNTGLGDKAVALATSYDTASYEADVTVGSSAELNRSKPTIARGSMSLQCDPKIWHYVVIDYNAGSAYIPQRMKLTENPILVTGIGRARAEAFHAFGNQVMIVGRRKPVLDQTTDADPGIASVSLDERSSACASL